MPKAVARRAIGPQRGVPAAYEPNVGVLYVTQVS
jgi:hypothetical protein